MTTWSGGCWSRRGSVPVDNDDSRLASTTLRRVNDACAEVLARQRSVARRDQLLATGLTPAQLRTPIRVGRWQALGPVVVVAHNGPLDRKQQWWAGVLSAGSNAALAGLTALEAAGLRNWDTSAVHVLVPRANTRSKITGVELVLHETRRRLLCARRFAGSPPHSSIERSAIDAASWRRDSRSCCGILAAVVQQRLTTAERLSVALHEAGPIRHHRVMKLAINDIAGGAHALSEIDFGRLCRRYSLGTLVRQQVRRDGTGRRRYLDGEIIGPSGKCVAFEVDGAVHLLPGTHWNDMHRQNELLIARTSLLRFSSYAVRFQPHVVADQIRRACAA